MTPAWAPQQWARPSLRNRLKAVRPDITVINTSVDNIPSDCDIAIVQTVLAQRAQESAPQAKLITIGNFLADPALDDLFFQLSTGDQLMVESDHEEPAEGAAVSNKDILIPEGIRLNLKSVSKEEAIQAAGALLHELGYVDEAYIRPCWNERRS